MGATLATAEFLVQARERGVSFERAGTVGRQAVFTGPERLLRLLRRYGAWSGTRRDFYALCGEDPLYLDPFLRALGARSVESIDASEYEGAQIVHDLNEPIGDDLRGRFSMLYDGGTLEHLFDVPTALRSYMEMVEVGGHLIIHTMANNNLGHGFYQFSPELFFRVLGPHNGYELERVVVVENDLVWGSLLGTGVPIEVTGPWYEVTDPARVGSRVMLVNDKPVVMQVQARRVADVPVLTAPTLQSDYVAGWEASRDQPAPAPEGWKKVVADRLSPGGLMELMLDVLPLALRPATPALRRRQRRQRSFANRRFYRRVK